MRMFLPNVPKVHSLLRFHNQGSPHFGYQQWRWVNFIFAFLLLGLLTGTTACNFPNLENAETDDSTPLDDLTFNNIRLDQTDEQGRPLWQVVAKEAVYNRDRQIAQIIKPQGRLFQDGRVVYQIEAATGEIQQNGKTILLRGQVMATDVRDNVILKGNQLEWKPNDDELTMGQNLTITHQQLTLRANEAKAYSRKHEIQVSGAVVATASQPPLRLVTEQVIWAVEQQQVIMDRPMQLEHQETPTLLNRVLANRSQINLKTQEITLQDKVQLIQQLSGQLQGQLKADQLVWQIPNQLVNAEGNVSYQRFNPPLFLKGPKAVGRLNDETVLVSGGRVVTEIVP